jgi:hypothetical protein
VYLPTSIWELASNGKYRKQFIPCQRSKVILKDDKNPHIFNPSVCMETVSASIGSDV